VGEMLEVWGVDSLQEMLDAPPLQHPSQVMKAKQSRLHDQKTQASERSPEDFSRFNQL
jgi:hypothetical protein